MTIPLWEKFYILAAETVSPETSAPSPRMLRLRIVALVLAFSPIFLANMVFAQRFRDSGDTTTAFAANLIGAMVGGVLEYTSLVLGFRNLLIVALVLYGLAFLFGRRHLTTAASN